MDAVLDGATRILSRARLQDTTTNKIAEMAGVGIGSLYDYFPNKESIVTSLMDRHIGNVKAEFEKLLAANPHFTVEQKVSEIVGFVEEKFFRNREFLREIFFLAPATGRMQLLYEARVEGVEQVTRYLLASPLNLAPEEAQRKAFLFVHGGIGLIDSYIMLNPPQFTPDQFGEELRRLMFHILGLRDLQS